MKKVWKKLKHPNPHIRHQGILEIAKNRDERTIPQLIKILEEKDTTYRRAAVKALGVIGIATIPALVEVSQFHENPTVRGSAVKALTQVAVNYPEIPFPDQGLQGLNHALDDEHPVVHLASVMALGVVGSSGFEGLAAKFNQTDNIALAVAIANTVGSIEDRRSLTFLQNIIQDDSVNILVKESAISALSRLEYLLIPS